MEIWLFLIKKGWHIYCICHQVLLSGFMSWSYPKGERGSNLMKSEEKQDKDDFTYQGPSNRSLGAWSHDQLPKMVKNKSCSPAL